MKSLITVLKWYWFFVSFIMKVPPKDERLLLWTYNETSNLRDMWLFRILIILIISQYYLLTKSYEMKMKFKIWRYILSFFFLYAVLYINIVDNYLNIYLTNRQCCRLTYFKMLRRTETCWSASNFACWTEFEWLMENERGVQCPN